MPSMQSGIITPMPREAAPAATRSIRWRHRALMQDDVEIPEQERTTSQQALLNTRAWFKENPIRSLVISAPIIALGGVLTPTLANGSTAVLVPIGGLVGACAAIAVVGGWMWAKAFPTHNAQARAEVTNERANCESAVSAERRVAAAANERWKREVEGALADARRGHARARLHQRLREGQRYVSEGMPVGVSGVAPLGVLIDWTHRVADDLDLLGITAVQLRSGGSRSVDEGSATRNEVEAEFDRRLDVLEHLIDQRLV